MWLSPITDNRLLAKQSAPMSPLQEEREREDGAGPERVSTAGFTGPALRRSETPPPRHSTPPGYACSLGHVGELPCSLPHERLLHRPLPTRSQTLVHKTHVFSSFDSPPRFRAGVPSPWSTDRYWSTAYEEPGCTAVGEWHWSLVPEGWDCCFRGRMDCYQTQKTLVQMGLYLEKKCKLP